MGTKDKEGEIWDIAVFSRLVDGGLLDSGGTAMMVFVFSSNELLLRLE
jgi:hypothetical protein